MNDLKSYRSPSRSRSGSDVLAQGFMTKVYLWMMFGLLATGGVAAYVSNSEQILSALFGRGMGVFFVLIIAQLGLVIYLSSKIMTLNPSTASVLFFSYAALNGLTLAPVLLVYTSESVSSAFFTTAAMFGAMSAYGAMTKRDLMGWASFLKMGVVGLLIALVVNMFLRSAMTTLVISIMGVIIFTALTAYDTQKLRRMSAELSAGNAGEDVRSNIAVLGALTLYLDFVNIFLYLLRIFGKRR